jgi:hypothetical protein
MLWSNGSTRPSTTIYGRCRHLLSYDELHDKFDGYLSAVTKAINSTVHTTLNATPTQLVFRRDAFLPVAFEADWNYIAERKQRLIVQNNKRERQAAPSHLQCQ